MTTVVPPPPPGTPPPAPPPAPTLVVPNPPPVLTAQSLGTLLQAVAQPAIAQQAAGTAPPGTPVVLQLPGGTVSLVAPWPLPEKAQLTFALDSHRPQTTLRLVAVDGKPATPALLAQVAQSAKTTGTQTGAVPAPSGLPGTAPQATPVSPPQAGPGPVVVTRGDAILATVLKPAAQTPAAVPAQPGPATVSHPSVAALGGGPRAPVLPAPTDGGPVRPGAVPAQTSAAPTPTASPPTAKTAAPSPAAGTQLHVRLLATAPAGDRLPPAPVPMAGSTVVAGTATGATPTGQPVVTTPQGQLALDTRTPLPPGTQVRLEILDLATAPRPSAQTPPPPLDPLGRTWPALRDAVEVLQQADPAAAQRLIDRAIPQPTAQLGSKLLFVMNALRGGDLRGWLGAETLRTLGDRKPATLDRLGEDSRALSRAASPAQSGDWRLYSLPLFGQELDQVRLMVRDNLDDPATEEEDERTEETRFIVDVDLSRMGRLQMDGLVRSEEKRFDLILRTADPLPAEMRDDIREIFREASEITGYKGGLTFQIGGRFVEPPSGAREEAVPDGLGLDV